MRNWVKKMLVATPAALLGAVPAMALWSDSQPVAAPTFKLGMVAFAAGQFNTPPAQGGSTPVSPTSPAYTMYQPDAPLELNIPGALILQTIQNATTSFWGFAAAGLSPESVGVDYIVSAIGQYLPAFTDAGGNAAGNVWASSANPVGSVWNGVASPTTQLSLAIVQVYPALGDTYANADALNSACGNSLSQLPPLPAYTTGSPNVYVYHPAQMGTTATLQPTTQSVVSNGPGQLPSLVDMSPPGTHETAGNPTQQYWCAAISPITNAQLTPPPPPGLYDNQFKASALGCAAAVLDPNTGVINCTDWATLNDASGKVVQPATTEIWINLAQAPGGEPDLVLQVSPRVTHITDYHTPDPNNEADIIFDVPNNTHPASSQQNPFYPN